MKNLSRGAWVAIAAAIAVPTTYAVAKGYHDGWKGMSTETRGRLDEGKIAGAKAALKLSPEQEKLWEPVEAEVRKFMKDRDARRAEHQKMREEMRKMKAEGKKPDMAERLEKMSQRMTERAERLKGFTEVFKPFYASLSEEQKEVLRPLARKLLPGMRHGHRGSRWSFGGGWDGHGGHHGHHGMRGNHGGGMGGKMMGDKTPDASPADTPDSDADDAQPGDAN
jgi:hypothetical protein